MTKEELLNEVKALIFGGNSCSFVCRNDGFIRVYDPTDSFTSCFISEAIRRTGISFIGVSVDWTGRPYMLFAY